METKESCLGNEEGPGYVKPHCLDVKLSLLTAQHVMLLVLTCLWH